MEHLEAANWDKDDFCFVFLMDIRNCVFFSRVQCSKNVQRHFWMIILVLAPNHVNVQETKLIINYQSGYLIQPGGF